MVAVKWLLENNVFGENLYPLEQALQAEGMEYHYVKYQPFGGLEYDWHYKDDDCVMFYGSLNLMKTIQKIKTWVPGGFCNLKNFRCTTYYPHFEKYLINSRRFVFPICEAMRLKEFVFLGQGKIFVRPNDGDKPFKGQVFSYDEFNLKGLGYGYYYDDDTKIIVISSVCDILNEYRFFVSGDKILSYSRYMSEKQLVSDTDVSQSAVFFVQEILREVKFRPDPVFCLDIAELADYTYGVVELNSFSCSGLYQCDPLPIVKEVTNLALEEYRAGF